MRLSFLLFTLIKHLGSGIYLVDFGQVVSIDIGQRYCALLLTLGGLFRNEEIRQFTQG